MFSKNSQQSSCIEEQFIIVYDKLTKRIAVSLRNRLRVIIHVLFGIKIIIMIMNVDYQIRIFLYY